jgi:hypothetical protein
MPNHLEEQRAHYAGVKERLYGRPKVVIELPPRPHPRVLPRLQKAYQKTKDEIRLFHTLGPQAWEARRLGEMRRAETLKAASAMYGDRRSVADIVKEVADFYGVTVDSVCGSRGIPVISTARKAAYYAIYMERPDLSLTEIGRLLGRDHSTIIHGARSFARLNGLPIPSRMEVGK